MTSKSEQTRERIVSTAMRLFTEQGYQSTTMRAIATEAGVSLGNAYYYFSSKQHLVHGFYDELQRRHQAATDPALLDLDSLAERLQTTLAIWFAEARPYREFAIEFFKEAADPDSPLSPLSEQSTPVRQRAIAQLADVVNGSNLSMDPRLRAALPELLWLFHMGLVLFWLYDRSPENQRTLVLIERGSDLIERVVKLSRFRILRSTTTEILDLIASLGGITPTAAEPQSPPPTRRPR